MHPGGCPTQAPGHSRDHVQSITGDYIDTNVLRVRATLMGHYRDKYYAPFVNGQYVGYNVYAPIDQPLEVLATFTNGTTLGSFYLEDAGDYATFGSTVPTGQAQNFDTITSNRLYLEWASTYSITSVKGDTQIASIVITGAKRSVNVGAVQGWPTRGMLTYSITSVGTTKVIRFWTPDGTMVAEGSRVGNGAVTVSAANNSGLSVTTTLTYSADVVPGVAFIELRWPKSFQIHYSTSALIFPRTPEATVNDTGSDNYLYLTAVLSSGTYNCNVLEVDDGGIVQTAGIPTTISKALNTVPLPPTITTATGTAAATTVNWTNGQTGCTYTVYYSHPNMPINYLSAGSPAPITTALNATSATLAAILNYTAVDDTTTALATLKTAFDSAVSTSNSAFTTGETGFATAVATLVTSLKSAMDTYSATIWLRMTPWKKQLDTATATLTNQITVFSGLLSTADWQTQIGQYYSRLLSTIGDFLEHNPGRYTLPNAAVGAGASGSSAVGTGGMASDGTSALSLSSTRYSLSDAAKPTIRPGVINVVVRATAGGIEEKNDIALSIEYTNAGAIYTPRPNTAAITNVVATTGLTLAVTGQAANDDAGGTATILDFYAQTTTPVDLTNPQASGALTDDGTGILSATVNYTLPLSGWYYLAVAARTAAGARSLTATERLLEFDNTGPGAVSGFTVKVVRGRGNRIG